MDQIRQLLEHKLKFMAETRDDWHAHAGPEFLLDELLREKKKQSQRELIEKRMMQGVMVKKIEAPCRVQQFYFKSLDLLKIYDPYFDFETQPDKTFKQLIIELFLCFFRKVGCEQRAEEILRIHEKKVVEEGLVIPTIFYWFTEWTRKRFLSFLKQNIQKQYLGMQIGKKIQSETKKDQVVESNIEKADQDKNREKGNIVQRDGDNLNDQNLMESVHKASEEMNENISNTCKYIGEEKLEQSIEQERNQVINSKDIQQTSKTEELKQQNFKVTDEKVIIAQNNEFSSLIQGHCCTNSEKSLQKNNIEPTLCLREVSQWQSIVFKHSNPKRFSSPQVKQQSQTSSSLMTRQMFYGSYLDELSSYYKQFQSIIGDIDLHFVRKIKRMDRPKDFKKCAKHAVSSLIRNMPRIKEEISDYFYSYSQKFQCSKQSKEKKINKVKPVEEKPWNVKPLDGKPVDNLRLNRKGQLKRYGESQNKAIDIISKDESLLKSRVLDRKPSDTLADKQSVPKSNKQHLSINEPLLDLPENHQPKTHKSIGSMIKLPKIRETDQKLFVINSCRPRAVRDRSTKSKYLINGQYSIVQSLSTKQYSCARPINRCLNFSSIERKQESLMEISKDSPEPLGAKRFSCWMVIKGESKNNTKAVHLPAINS